VVSPVRGVEVLPATGQIVGVLPADVPPTQLTRLAAGDALVLYSDGFTEVRRDGELFGEAGMLSTLRDLPAGAGCDDIAASLTAAVAEYGPQPDDMALLVFAVRAGEAQPPPLRM
jgi:sigma-B regulation protein RsbU (phosphoserine phosphatase)